MLKGLLSDSPSIVQNTSKQVCFQVDLVRRDSKHAIDLAMACGARLEVVEVVDKHLKKAEEIGGGKMDISYPSLPDFAHSLGRHMGRFEMKPD